VPTPTSLTSFHADAGLRVGVFQVVNELSQVLDGVDVVVRRGADQPDAWRGVADLADVVIDLVAGELPALAGLGALGHLDLQFVGIDQVFGGDAEAGAGDLLDGAAAEVAVGVGLEAVGVLAALAGIALPADAVSWRSPGSREPPWRSTRSSWRR